MPLFALIPAALAVYSAWVIIKYDPNSRFNL